MTENFNDSSQKNKKKMIKTENNLLTFTDQ